MKHLKVERLKELLEYNRLTGMFVRKVSQGGKKAGTRAGTLHSKGYREIKIDGRIYKEHRLAWLDVYGEWPIDQLDHINGLKADNRISNLREADNALNNQNVVKAQSNNQLGLLGVHRIGKRYRAQIGVGGTMVYLGNHATPEKAHQVYLDAKCIFHTGSML